MGRPRKGKRDALDTVLCPECAHEAETPQGEPLARLLLSRPVVPDGYADTHELCLACLELRRHADGHEKYCEFARAGIQLKSGGWATRFSEALRYDLRAHRPKWQGIVATILSSLIRAYAQPDFVMVPVPISGGVGGRDGLLEALSTVRECTGLPVIRALLRGRRESTRASVAQIRRSIVANEYHVNERVQSLVKGKTVLLFDDNVTTGITMVGVAGLLLRNGVSRIIPLSLDRTVSPRLRQRLEKEGVMACPHMRAHIREP
jgi:predicted amidophosphoribosyltransferase